MQRKHQLGLLSACISIAPAHAAAGPFAVAPTDQTTYEPIGIYVPAGYTYGASENIRTHSSIYCIVRTLSVDTLPHIPHDVAHKVAHAVTTHADDITIDSTSLNAFFDLEVPHIEFCALLLLRLHTKKSKKLQVFSYSFGRDPSRDTQRRGHTIKKIAGVTYMHMHDASSIHIERSKPLTQTPNVLAKELYDPNTSMQVVIDLPGWQKRIRTERKRGGSTSSLWGFLAK